MRYKMKDGFLSFSQAWKSINYKKALIWGMLSSLYTALLLLLIGYISEIIPDPLIGYITKSICSSIIIIPIFLMAYLIIDKKSISYFKYSIFDFYKLLLPCIFVSSLAGIVMIFTGNIYIFYGIVFLIGVYLFFTVFSPFYIFERKDLKDAIFISVKKIFNNFNLLIPLLLNIFFAVLIFKAVGFITYSIAQHNINIGLVLTIIFALTKPLLYMLPLFNILTVVKELKDKSSHNKNEIDKVGDVI